MKVVSEVNSWIRNKKGATLQFRLLKYGAEGRMA